MGTTLHAHIEVKADRKWHHFAAPKVDRNYLLFALLNGTRREDFKENPEVYSRLSPVCTCHEIPDDASIVTVACLAMDSAHYALHGFGTIGPAQLELLQNRLHAVSGKVYDPECDLEESIFRTYIGGGSIAVHQGFDDVRVIFWYDN